MWRRSSQSHLLAQIDQLGTNLLTVVNGLDSGGTDATLPTSATPMIRQIPNVCITRGWSMLIPPRALWSGLLVSVAAGGVAGLYPALRAARIPPTDALWTA